MGTEGARGSLRGRVRVYACVRESVCMCVRERGCVTLFCVCESTAVHTCVVNDTTAGLGAKPELALAAGLSTSRALREEVRSPRLWQRFCCKNYLAARRNAEEHPSDVIPGERP